MPPRLIESRMQNGPAVCRAVVFLCYGMMFYMPSLMPGHACGAHDILRFILASALSTDFVLHSSSQAISRYDLPIW